MGFADVESSRYERSFGARGTCLILDICLYFRAGGLANIRPRFHYPWHVYTNEDILGSHRWISALNTSFEQDAVGLLMYIFPILSIYKILYLPSLPRTSIYHQYINFTYIQMPVESLLFRLCSECRGRDSKPRISLLLSSVRLNETQQNICRAGDNEHWHTRQMELVHRQLQMFGNGGLIRS